MSCCWPEALARGRRRCLRRAQCRQSSSAAGGGGAVDRVFCAAVGCRLKLLPQTAEDEQVVGAPTAPLPRSRVFCGAEPPHTSQPVSASCNHRACYYCVATARLASTRALPELRRAADSAGRDVSYFLARHHTL